MFTWTKEGKEIFEERKEAIVSSLTLVNPNFNRYFILYTLGGETSTYAVLTRLNDDNIEQPIALFIKGLEEYEDRYSYVER